MKKRERILDEKLRPEDTLTPREFETVRLLAEGLSRSEMARRLGIKVGSVGQILWAARDKTGRETPVAMALWFNEKYTTEDSRNLAYMHLCVRAYRQSHQGKRVATVRNLGK